MADDGIPRTDQVTALPHIGLVLSANLSPTPLLLLLPPLLLQIVALQLLSTQLAEVLAAVHNAAGAMLQLSWIADTAWCPAWSVSRHGRV
jgi:hypothetical protein